MTDLIRTVFIMKVDEISSAIRNISRKANLYMFK